MTQKSKVAPNGKSCQEVAPNSKSCQNVAEQLVAEASLVRGTESDPPSGIFADIYHFKPLPEGIAIMHVYT